MTSKQKAGSSKKSVTSSHKRVNLSSSKFLSHLTSNNFSIISLGYENIDSAKNILLVEIKTPNFLKNFYVYIPRNYKLPYDEKTMSNYRAYGMYSIDTVPHRQVSYLSEVKGTMIEDDLISISNNLVVVYHQNEKVECYKLNAVVDNPSKPSHPNNPSRQLKSLEHLLMGEEVVPVVYSDDSEESNEVEEADDDTIKTYLDKSKIIELEFQDFQGNIIDDSITDLLDTDAKVSNDTTSPEKLGGSRSNLSGGTESSESKHASKKGHTILGNDLPETILDKEITLGMIYVVYDISTFLAKGDSLEKDIVTSYNSIDDNILDMRRSRLASIKTSFDGIYSKVESRLEKYSKDELNMKTNLLKLVEILNKANQIKNNVSNEKFLEIKPEFDRTYNQTKTTVDDININLLRLQDTIDDVLVSCESLIEILTSHLG